MDPSAVRVRWDGIEIGIAVTRVIFTWTPWLSSAGGSSLAYLASMTTSLIDRLRNDGLDPGAWSNGSGDRYAAHEHGYDKVLVVERGSIRFGLPGRGDVVSLAVGDRLDLPAGTRHDAVVGSDGVTCLEAHLPAGSLAALARREAGTW